MKPVHIIAAAALTLLLAGCATTPPPSQAEIDAHDYGPEPSQYEFWNAASVAVKDRLKDPESARFRPGTGIRRGYWQELFGGRYWGYYACGWVNAKNSFGGYVGDSAFVAVYDRGVITHVEMDSSDGGLVLGQCRQAGLL